LISLKNEISPKKTSCHKERRRQTPTQIFDNNQPRMVQKCQMANKQLQTSVPKSHAEDQNIIMPTSKKKSRQQP
jgi:hypothetical protein